MSIRQWSTTGELVLNWKDSGNQVMEEISEDTEMTALNAGQATEYIKTKNKMANCKQCGAGVGCGCHLTPEGLCASCAQKKRIQSLPPQPKPPLPPQK